VTGPTAAGKHDTREQGKKMQMDLPRTRPMSGSLERVLKDKRKQQEGRTYRFNGFREPRQLGSR